MPQLQATPGGAQAACLSESHPEAGPTEERGDELSAVLKPGVHQDHQGPCSGCVASTPTADSLVGGVGGPRTSLQSSKPCRC